MKSLRGRSATLTLAALMAIACGTADQGTGSAMAPGQAAAPIDVVANFFPVAEMATRVGGDRVKVDNLTPPGVEPHDLELTPRQVDALEDADLVLYLGQGFQPALAQVAERQGAAAVDLLASVLLDEGAVGALEAEEAPAEESDQDHAAEGGRERKRDPHFWLDPTLLSGTVDQVADALTQVSPDDAGTFRANAERYKDELAILDGEFSRGLATCERREIVTSHAAFFYLARRYGLTQTPIAGLSPEGEPDAERIAALTDEIRSKGITTIFFEELVSPKAAEALAREARVTTAVLSPIEGLSEDDVKAGKDYSAVMRENLVALRQALACR